MKSLRAVVVLISVLAVAACAQMGLATPKGFDQQLAESYGVYTAVVSATATAVTVGTLTSAEGTALQGQEVSARSLLDAAKAAETAGNTVGANNDLLLATSALTALQSYLNNQPGKGHP